MLAIIMIIIKARTHSHKQGIVLRYGTTARKSRCKKKQTDVEKKKRIEEESPSLTTIEKLRERAIS